MAKITTGQSFNAGDQLTSTKLNNIVGSAFLDSGSITGTTLNLTNGQLKVATNGITDNELNANSVTTAKIANDAVTYAKIQDVAASSVIGNTTAIAANPTNVAILDEDDMATDSATSLATQQSIKAYVDNKQFGINFVTPTAILDIGPTYSGNSTITTATTAWPGPAGTGPGTLDVYETITINTSIVPATASAIILRAITTVQDDNGVSCNAKIYIKTSSYAERLISFSAAFNNADDSGADCNQVFVPYTSTIDVKFSGKGLASGTSAKLFIDGYIS